MVTGTSDSYAQVLDYIDSSLVGGVNCRNIGANASRNSLMVFPGHKYVINFSNTSSPVYYELGEN